MIKVDKPRKISCFTPEQQIIYDKLMPRQRAYIDFRAKGYGKADSYRKSGYKITKNVGQNAYLMERGSPIIKELIETLSNVRKAKDILKADSDVNKQLDALAEVKTAEQALETIANADGETLKQIQFYRDVINGKIQTVKKTIFTNKAGEKSYKEERISDVDTKIKARRELDRLLGIGSIIDLGRLETGDITINIVDASKKDALEDDRNKVIIDLGEQNVEADGEVIIVEEKKEKNVKSKVLNTGNANAEKEVEQEEYNINEQLFDEVGV